MGKCGSRGASKAKEVKNKQDFKKTGFHQRVDNSGEWDSGDVAEKIVWNGMGCQENRSESRRGKGKQVPAIDSCKQSSGEDNGLCSMIERLWSLTIQDETADKEGRTGNSKIEDGNIYISYPFLEHDNKLQTLNVGGSKSDTICIGNHQPGSLILYSVEFLIMKPRGCFNLSEDISKVATCRDPSIASLGRSSSALICCPKTLESGEEFTLRLTCKAAMMGLHQLIILFDFGEKKVARCVSLMAEDKLATNLSAANPFERKRRSKVRKPSKVFRGKPPRVTWFRKCLGQYKYPEELRATLSKTGTLPIFSAPLTEKTYVEYFSALLHAEEIQMEKQVRQYDMENATLREADGFMVLQVPGLLEGRPSVIYRNAIYVTLSSSDVAYQGFVHMVKRDEVFLKFGRAFHETFATDSHVNVQFPLNRINLRRAHRAIRATTYLPRDLLFPTELLPMDNPPPFTFRSIFNKALNKEQTSAVREVMKRSGGGQPYLIYGPPGTGKTLTLIETILQVLRHVGDARILACAPSNSASDVLVERLIDHVEEKDMLRLNAYSRPFEETPPHIRPYTHTQNGFFTCPPREKLAEYKVVVSTFESSGCLDAQEITRGHFSHIVLDEAGQATEPGTMIPIANLANKSTVLVLAGDPHQLGPVIFSSIAEKHGLSKSYFERLSLLPPYNQTPPLNKSMATKLIRNYRSHPTILHLPSHLFYNGELIACAQEKLRSSLCNWEELPNKSFPFLFIGIEGKEEREGRNPSWFNAQEASKVVEVVKKLQAHRRNPVSNADIGIISPYNQQVKKVEMALAMNSINDIKVGSVEQFQGQERRVIIISTVRSSVEVSGLDKQHSMDFLKNPRRFNVAITRAKALVVVIGNPYVLSQDLCWNELIKYCLAHDSYIGCAPPSEEYTRDVKALLQRLNELSPKG